MDEDREGLDGAQHVLPVTAFCGAPEDSDAPRMIGFPEIARDACIDVRLIGHDGISPGS